jgi:hypothetical protein
MPRWFHQAVRNLPLLQSIFQELVDYAKECCVFRELTEAERAQFGLK